MYAYFRLALSEFSPIKSNPLYFEFKNQAMKIPVVNSSSPIKILAESVKGFMSYART